MAVALATQAPNPIMMGPLGLIAPPEIEIECDAFSGTLGTLVRCVIQEKVELLDVPIAPICQAYLRYLEDCFPGDVDSAASALIALAYLVERKAYRLLPVPEVIEEDDLPYDGPEIIDFQTALDCLESGHHARQELFFRTGGEVDFEIPFHVGNIGIPELGKALQRIMDRATKAEPDVMLSRPRRSLADQMKLVARCLQSEPKPIMDLIEGEFSRVEAMWWFLALLELVRLNQAVAILREGEIYFRREVIEG